MGVLESWSWGPEVLSLIPGVTYARWILWIFFLITHSL